MIKLGLRRLRNAVNWNKSYASGVYNKETLNEYAMTLSPTFTASSRKKAIQFLRPFVKKLKHDPEYTG